MPKATVKIAIENPDDYLKVLEGQKFKRSAVSFSKGNGALILKIDAEDKKALETAQRAIRKQIKIIAQTIEIANGKD